MVLVLLQRHRTEGAFLCFLSLQGSAPLGFGLQLRWAACGGDSAAWAWHYSVAAGARAVLPCRSHSVETRVVHQQIKKE